jgi:aryl-alcohol dehydrogenase-like predicted oxidoreductase
MVTRFVLGGAPIAGLYAAIGEEAAQATLEHAWAAGVRAFDTAPHYGVGLSESRLGRFFATRPRSEVVVTTKIGRLLVPTDEDVEGVGNFYGSPKMRRILDYSRAGARRSIEESCARLGLERVDVALVHDPDDHFAQAMDEALPALADLRAEGVVGAIGVAMNQAPMLARFVREADIDCVMVAGRWTLLDRSAGEELLPLCQERHVGVFAAAVLNSGILVDPKPGATYDYAPASPERLAAAYQLQRVCARHGVALRAAALQFPLRHPAVTAIVVGARTPDEVTADLADLDRHTPDELWAELDAS